MNKQKTLMVEITEIGIAFLKPIESGYVFDMRDALEAWVRENPGKLLMVDLTRTPFISAAGLAVLLEVHVAIGNNLEVLISKDTDVEHMLEITKLAAVLNVRYKR